MTPAELNDAIRTSMNALAQAATLGLDGVQPCIEQHILDLLDVQARQAHDMSLDQRSIRSDI